MSDLTKQHISNTKWKPDTIICNLDEPNWATACKTISTISDETYLERIEKLEAQVEKILTKLPKKDEVKIERFTVISGSNSASIKINEKKDKEHHGEVKPGEVNPEEVTPVRDLGEKEKREDFDRAMGVL